jgi:hypothetical protein
MFARVSLNSELVFRSKSVYIITNNKTVIPVSRIKLVRPRQDGSSVIVLSTGEQIKDTREAVEVLASAYYKVPDIAPIVSYMSEISREIKNLKHRVGESIDLLRASTTGISTAERSLKLSVKDVQETQRSLDADTRSVSRVISSLEKAIDEC